MRRVCLSFYDKRENPTKEHRRDYVWLPCVLQRGEKSPKRAFGKKTVGRLRCGKREHRENHESAPGRPIWRVLAAKFDK
eukprot:5094785-Pleurochrysis_carterae.AAC.1